MPPPGPSSSIAVSSAATRATSSSCTAPPALPHTSYVRCGRLRSVSIVTTDAASSLSAAKSCGFICGGSVAVSSIHGTPAWRSCSSPSRR